MPLHALVRFGCGLQLLRETRCYKMQHMWRGRPDKATIEANQNGGAATVVSLYVQGFVLPMSGLGLSKGMAAAKAFVCSYFSDEPRVVQVFPYLCQGLPASSVMGRTQLS